MPALRVAAPAGEADRAFLAQLWTESWAGDTVVGGGREWHLRELQSLIAWYGADPIASASYDLPGGAGSDAELVSIATLRPARRHGAASALLAAVEDACRQAGAVQLRLVTTNDNLAALRFYQRRGYRIVAVHPGAVDEARVMKPSIPEIGEGGIPVRDELELAKALG